MKFPSFIFFKNLLHNKLVFILALLFSLISEGRGQSLSLPIHLSYYSPYFLQPGAKLGTSVELMDVSGNGKDRTLSLSPQVAFFSQLGVNQNYLLNAELNLSRQREDKKRVQGFGIGLGYLLSSKNLGPVVNLGSAEVSSGERENASFVLPTLSYSLGLRPDKGPPWQVKFFLGRKISFEDQGELFFGFETGISLNDNK